MILCSIKPLKSAFTFLMLALLTGATLAQDADKKSTDDNLKITISKETTWFTEPLTENGEVDYVKAVNRHFSKGATPENNLVTAAIKVCGVRYGSKQIRNAATLEKVERVLAIESLPDPKDCLVDFFDFVSDEYELSKVIEIKRKICGQPWSREQFPDAAKWIERYSPLVDWYVKQFDSKATYFFPHLPGRHYPKAHYFGEFQFLNALMISEFLKARSMMRLNEGDVQGCQKDLIAIRKSASLVCSSRTSADVSLFSRIHELAVSGEIQMFLHDAFESLHLEQYQSDIEKLKLSYEFNFERAITENDRTMALNMAALVRSGDASFANWAYCLRDEQVSEFTLRSTRRLIDWDEVFRMINDRFDERESLFKSDSKMEILQGIRGAKTAESERYKEDQGTLARRLLMSQGAKKNVAMVEAIQSFVPDMEVLEFNFESFCDRLTWESMIKVYMALKAYEFEHGAYPDSLDVLVPTYIRELPTDIYSGKPIIYKKQDKHFLLYSIGSDQKDDGGAIGPFNSDIAITSDPEMWESQFN